VRQTEWELLSVGEWDTTQDNSAASFDVQQLMVLFNDLIHEEHEKVVERHEEKVKELRSIRNPTPEEQEELANLLATDPGLPNGYGKMIIENWQDGLKKVTMRVFWTPEGDSEQTFEKTFYIHDEANYEEG
jgi:hypothetical protein